MAVIEADVPSRPDSPAEHVVGVSLDAYLHSRLAEGEAADVERHLLICGPCRERLAQAFVTARRSGISASRGQPQPDNQAREPLSGSAGEGFVLGQMIYDQTGKPADFRLLAVNAQLFARLGLKPEKILGRTCRATSPGLDECIYEILGRVVATGEPAHFEARDPNSGAYLECAACRCAVGQFALIFRDITGRRHAEQALRENEERLRLAIDSAHMGLFDYYPQTGKLIWSDHAKQHFGLPASAEADYGTFLRGLHPEDRDRVDQLVQDVLCAHNGGKWATEYRTIGIEDGKERWLSTWGRVFFDTQGRASRFIGVGLDITDHKQIQQLAENLREVLWMVDAKAEQLLYVSPAYEQVWGRPVASLYENSRSFLEAIHPEDRARVTNAYENEIRHGVPIQQEYRLIRPDGSFRWIRDRSFPIKDSAGQIFRFAGIAEDITGRKQVEGRLNGSFAQIRALAARLQTAREEERKRVAREIHDELGQALTAIKLDLSSWIRDLPPQPGPSKRAEALLALVDRTIQSVRRISTELRPGILDDLGLAAAVEWAVEEFEAHTGIKCRLELTEQDLAPGAELATALFRILQETLTNVARHANATAVEVWLAKGHHCLCLRVCDNGRGITEEQLSGGGSLGILGMKERALLLGGQLTISGSPGAGTTVDVSIPETRKPSVASD